MELNRISPRTIKPALALLLGLWAGNSLATGLAEGLLQCQPSFFKNLHAQRGELARQVKLSQDDKAGVAWISVADRTSPEGALLTFAHPVDDNGLPLTAWYDRAFDLGAQGTYYFWGFETVASREEVMAKLPQAQWEEAGEYFISRPQIKPRGSDAWQDNPSAASGIAPAAGSAEKLLMLSTEDGKTRLLCSLQGSIDTALLQRERPDVVPGAGQ